MKIKVLFATILFVFCLCLSVAAQSDFCIPSLMYHNINDDYEDKNASVEISAEKFKEHMVALKNEGYTAIFFDEYIKFLNNQGNLPEKPILITFDDGYLNNYTVGFPILKETGMKATIFIVTGRMGLQGAVTYPHFNWEQASEMEKSGLVDIQSHTQYHGYLTQMPYSSAVLELRKSKFVIEKNLNKKVEFLAYPYGACNESVIEIAKKAGYKAAALAEPVNAGVNRKGENPFLTKRITVYGNMSGADLIREISNNESW